MAQNLNHVLGLIAHHHTQITEAQNSISQEKLRLEQLEKKSSDSQSALANFREELKGLNLRLSAQEKELAELEKNIEKATANANNATSTQQADAAQKQIDSLTPRFDALSEESLETLEKMEELEASIKEKESFLTGLESTSKELHSEVEANIQARAQEIEALEQQIESEFYPGMRKEYIPDVKAARKKLFEKNPFSPLKAKSCSKCGQSVDSFQFTALERGDELEFCSGCSRILFIKA